MNKKMKIALTLIAVILIAALAISLAYSRYFTKITGEGTATVAKWHFDAKKEGAENLGAITLANTVAANSKVAEGKIAPGTSGSFNVELDATGTEVELDYKIQLQKVSGEFPTNLKFYATKTGDTYSNEITDIANTGLEGTLTLDDTTKTIKDKKVVTIYWNWAYQTGDESNVTANDEVDTNEGEAASNITFNVIVTGTQAQNA